MDVTRTQRWRNRRHSWRPVHEGGFRANRYSVVRADHHVVAAFCRTHHYSASWPSVSYAFALLDHDPDPAPPQPGEEALGGRLVGAIALGVPMSQRVLTNPFPTLLPAKESLELSRLVLLDDVPANAETWAMGRVCEQAAREGVRALVAFADPVPRYRRDPNGDLELVKPGHLGHVYRAGGWTYTGRGTRRRLIVLPDATVLTARAAAKVTGGERGAGGVIRRLAALGATPPEPDCETTTWLRTALAQVGATTLAHPGNHRYVRRIGRTRGERTRTVIALPALPAPCPLPDLS